MVGAEGWRKPIGKGATAWGRAVGSLSRAMMELAAEAAAGIVKLPSATSIVAADHHMAQILLYR
jgi:hypothetical protein